MEKTVYINLNGRSYEVVMRRGRILVNGRDVSLGRARLDNTAGLHIRNGELSMHAVIEASDGEGFVGYRGRELRLLIETERDRLLKLADSGAAGSRHHAEIKASMPGLVVKVLVKPGEEVAKGQPVLILEAMKMENEIRAPSSGIVKEIRVKEKQALEKGDLLAVLD